MSKKNNKQSSYSPAVRITCIVLAGLTVLGVAASILIYLFS